MNFPFGEIATLLIIGSAPTSCSASPWISGQGNRPGKNTRNIDLLNLQSVLTQRSDPLRENLGCLGVITEHPGRHFVDPDEALVVPAGQELETAQTSNVHEEVGGLPPGELHEILHLDHLLIGWELVEVGPEDDDLGVVDTLDSHQLITQTADTVHMGEMMGDSLQPDRNWFRPE